MDDKRWQSVGEAEYKAFVESYPRPLDSDVCRIYEPPLASLNDFTLGKWPESMVAKHVLSKASGYPEPDEYYVRIDL